MKKKTEQIELPLQLDFVDRLKKLLLDWTKQNEIRLHTVDCVVPFVLTDKGLSEGSPFLVQFKSRIFSSL
jgi:hypothetical protein